MDPALWELLRAEAGTDGDRVLEAIIRLARPAIEIPDIRIVSRFGTIATCRIRARDIVPVRARRDVVSLKAARGLNPGCEPAVGAAIPGTLPQANFRPADVRRDPGLALTGKGVVVASVDWGIDVDSAAFRWPADPATAGGNRPAGGTRFLSFWDQRNLAAGPCPDPFGYGTVHDREQIDDALHDPRPYEKLGYHPAIADRGGHGTHGTHVLDIAAGNGQAGGPVGIAPEADLVFVHLADRTTGGLANLGDSVRLLEAVDFISRTAGSQPCVINISAGRTCGPKDGTTLVERALDELLTATPGRFVVNSAGNYFGWRTHSCGRIAAGESRSLTFVIDPADITPNELEIWYDGADEFAVRIDPPGYTGGRAVRLGERSDLLIEGQRIGRIYHRRHDPNNGDNHIVAYIDPIGRAGTWTVTLEARQVTSGRFHAWIERDDTCRGCQARFTPADSNPVTTIGTITTSWLPLIVGAYNGHDPARSVAPFSSSGPSRDLRPKPDLAAPGVDVLAARSASTADGHNPGLLVRKSGTSMAAPHVTGAVALCLEAAGNALSARQIRSLVLGSCDPALDADAPYRVGRGYLNIPRLIADLQRTLTAPSTKEPTMNTDDSVVPLAAAPATVYREYLYRPHSQLARWIDERFDVVARPGQRLGQGPQLGDVLLEVTLGRVKSGRCLVLKVHNPELEASPRRLSAGQLLLRPRKRAEMSEPLPVEPTVETEGSNPAADVAAGAQAAAPAPPLSGTLENDQFIIDPGYHSDKDDHVPAVWELADRVRALLQQKTHDKRDRDDLEKAVARQLRTAVLYQTVSRIVKAATSPGRLTIYVLLFPGEGRDNTGIKDLNDNVLGPIENQRFIARRQEQIEGIFHPHFVVVGQDYKTALFVTWEQNRAEFDKRLHKLDKALRQILLEDFLPNSKREGAKELQRVLEKDPDYRFDVYYGTDGLDVSASTRDVLLTIFLLLTQALKAAATARYVAKGRALKVRVVKPFGQNAAPDKKFDPRGKRFAQPDFLRAAGTAPAIKAFVLKSPKDQVAMLEYNIIYVDTVWTQAFFREQNVGNRDVIRDVRKNKLVKPPLPNIKSTFAAQKELLELWIVVLNLIDFIKDFLEEEFAHILVLNQHDNAVLVLENIRDLAKPMDTRQAEDFLTRDLRQEKLAVLGTASEFQFYSTAADYPARIVFMMDVRDLGVEVLMMYDISNAEILDGRLADRRLLQETIRSTDVVTEMRRFTYDMVVQTFGRYHALLKQSGPLRRTDGSKEAARAFKKAFDPLGEFDKDVQVMLGGDEVMVAAHPRFAAYLHNIVADLSATVLGPHPAGLRGLATTRMLRIRTGVAFSLAKTAGERRKHQLAHNQAMELAGGSHGLLKDLERRKHRIERLLDMLERNPDKEKDAPKYRKRLDELRMSNLFTRVQHGNPTVLPMRRIEPLVGALREGKLPTRDGNLTELVDFDGNVVDHGRLIKDADALEQSVRKKVGRDNLHVDTPPAVKVPLPKEKDDDDG